jgi:hypothetical protein
MSQFFVNGPSRYFNNQNELDDLNDFFDRNNRRLGVIANLKNEIIESVQSNIRWMSVNYVNLSKWLVENT